MKSLVTLSYVTFEWPNGARLFTDCSFSLENQITALVGPNGLGKTTLCKLIVGELEPTSGSIHRRASAIYLPQRELAPEVSITDYLSEAYDWNKTSENLLEGLDRNQLCSTLSGGQWMKVRLARVLDDHFLILDEPTNDLDREGRDVILRYLTEHQFGALIISHDRECLQLCDHVLELSNKGLSKYSLSWNEYEKTKTTERSALQKNLHYAELARDQAFEKRNELMAKQEKRNRRGQKQAEKGGIPKILLGARKRRAEATTGSVDVHTLEKRETAVSEAVQAYNEVKVEPIMYFDLLDNKIPQQKLIAEARDFNVQFQDWIYPRNLNFIWRGNIRLGLKGLNGSGKSTLLKMIMGHEFTTQGDFQRGSIKVLYLDQSCSQLDDSKSVLENIRDSSLLDETDVRNNLAEFLFTKDKVHQQVDSLSGGERLRAALAKGLMQTQKPDLLILDEPTNNLDLQNIRFLEQLIQAYQGAVIIVSHDKIFLQNCQLTAEMDLSL
jgi:ATPase subunit of ABC transporter with duplicated ATPase domains